MSTGNILTIEDITGLDRQIDQLYEYKPIPEHEVKALCDKVCPIFSLVRCSLSDWLGMASFAECRVTMQIK